MERIVIQLSDKEFVPILLPEGLLIDNIPSGVYSIMGGSQAKLEKLFDKFSTSPLYGKEYERIKNKVVNRYHQMDKTLAALFIGEKGMGKTAIAKQIANAIIEDNVPVFMIDRSIKKSALLALIELFDKAVFFFDEFEKNFDKTYDSEIDLDFTQEDLLSILGGIYNNKKHLFLFTANSEFQINEFFLNRPERIRYIFKFSHIPFQAIQEFFEAHNITNIDLTPLRRIKRLNYDILNYIVEELQFTTDLEEIIQDLGISKTLTYKLFKVFDSMDKDITSEVQETVIPVTINPFTKAPEVHFVLKSTKGNYIDETYDDNHIAFFDDNDNLIVKFRINDTNPLTLFFKPL